MNLLAHSIIVGLLFVIAVNSPGNVALWKEKERLEALEHHH